LIADALQSAGDVPKVYRMLSERSCPSFLYPVTMGATTIWERWDSMLPDGSINPGDMTSFNHYALGAIADWMHRSIAGIAPGAPGYRHVLVRPRPGGQITSATARLDSVYGRIEVAWRTDDDQITVEVTIPPNSTAALQLQDGDPEVALSSGHHVVTLPFHRPVGAAEPSRPGEQP
jgi:alpha-L-rhamnosidase